ncbi:protein of unknown function [Ruminococcaceae bacterium BL-6]|nr:protein of unknown function [Ruminococcaceae bacterium BL-6]
MLIKQYDKILKNIERGDAIIMLQNNSFICPKYGDIWWVNIPNAIGSQQGGTRPMLIVSNDTYNRHSPTVTACSITSQVKKHSPVHIFVSKNDVCGLDKDSVVLVEKIWDINKNQLISKIGKFPIIKERELAEKFLIQFPVLSMVKN